MKHAAPGSGEPRSHPPFLSSIKLKFVTALILLVSVVLGASTWWGLSVHRAHMLDATREKVRARAEAIHHGIQVAMRGGRHEEIQQLVERAASDPDVRQVLVLDAQGRVQKASRHDLVGRTVDRDRLSRYVLQPDLAVTEFLDGGEPIHSVIKRIVSRPECVACHGGQALLGVLHVDMSFRNTDAQIAEMNRTAVWTMLLAAAALATGGALLLVRLVDRPVARLVHAIARVEQGDLETRASVASRDELGRLTESFNTMVGRLRAARDEIEGYHRQRLLRAERLATLGEFAAAVAHEIKNPLAGIAGAVRVMADDLPQADPKKEIMAEVVEQVRRLDKAVRDLLAFARPGVPERAPCDLHQTLDRVLILLAENPAARAARVVRRYAGGIPRLEADEQQLGQVFLNLFLNAIQAMPGGGQLTITTALRAWERLDGEGPGGRGPVVEVAVSDTGPGVPAHALREVFQPFFTLKHHGTGLGLSISRRIVEDHGGWIRAESPPGQGATFRVFLPLPSAAREEAPA
jgi:signal transduction histidine kinase